MSGGKRKEKRRQKQANRASAEVPESAEAPATGAVSDLSRWSALALLVAALALGLWLLERTWLKWADVLVDYGRELYVPWRLAEGDVLYRDIAYFNGPVSPYWNALWFGLFGPGYSVQVWVNLALLVAFVVLLHRLLTRLGSAVTAGLTLCFALPVFIFAHNAGIANYNFVSPYSHEMTHGLLLGVLALGSAMRVDAASQGNRRGLLLTGALLGLLFLTKAEIFAATALGIAVLLGGQLLASGASLSIWRRAIGLVLGAAVLVPVVAFLLLVIAMPASVAGLGVLGSWTGILGSEVSDLPFYKVGMGMDNPSARLELMSVSLGVLALAFAPGFLLDSTLRAGPKPARDRAIATILGVATFFVWRTTEVFSERLAFPLPFVLGLIVLVVGWRFLTSKDPEERRQLAARLGFSVFGLAMLAKMILNVRFEHYGFVLAFPAMAVLFLATTAWLPGWMRARGGSGLLVTASCLGVFAAVAVARWEATEVMLARKVNEVGEGRDRMWTDSRGLYVHEALQQIEQRFGPEDELLVIPEGITLNYWSRRRAPVAYTNYMPPELILYGEDAIIAALEANPPAGVVMVHKNTSEYGFPLFGTDYAADLMRWVLTNYAPTWMDERAGAPLQPKTGFGIGILERRN